MKNVVILRYGEIHLKGRNRGMFENVLMQNLRQHLINFSCKISRISGRYLVSNFEEKDTHKIVELCKKVFGFVSLSVAFEVESDENIIKNAVLEKIKEITNKNKTFKVFTKRADKNFPINSAEFSAKLGEMILDNFSELKVDIHEPELEILVDIRENGLTYIAVDKEKCVGGMPVGTGGKGLLMLSGGIDSPVAGFMVAKRGMKLSAVHFHSYPYTSELAKEKVLNLAKILATYTGEIKIFLVSFTKIQEQIHTNCDSDYMINIMRRIMMRVCEKICENNNLKTIITGESLGQVASQTIESITTTNAVVKNIPVIRPLIAFDKTEIIDIAKKIGTFETSILPYEDCCTVFLPENPIIKPTIKSSERQENYLNIEDLVQMALNSIEIITVKNQ